MKYRVTSSASFDKEIKRLNKRYHSIVQDVIALRDELLSNPTLGIDLGGGLRKVRMRITSKGRGKSGGARVLTFTVVVNVDEAEINLLYIYDKTERESITHREINALLEQNDLK